jgi:hypothetical protein
VIPAGLLATEPAPVPALVTVNVTGSRLKLAVTVDALLAVTVHEPVPEHPPLQPSNFEPDAGVAASVTTVPTEYGSEQSEPQLIPAGLLETVPAPPPALATVNVTGSKLKLAVTVDALLAVTVHEPVPEHAPVQPSNFEPVAGVAANVTDVPSA